MQLSVLVLSLIFGLVGMGLFMYGRSQQRYVHVGSGVALMVIPYFIPHAVALAVVCVILSAVPFVFGRS